MLSMLVVAQRLRWFERNLQNCRKQELLQFSRELVEQLNKATKNHKNMADAGEVANDTLNAREGAPPASAARHEVL